ncbi:hypothetical protein K2173_007178 [Erythroxylum novogranatense]|uniref:Patellin-3 n=1 Tax=Erythroxylum novogranatense TaxID=1862640 RepID=A0AAV8T069_9ROSI|nr:hypothetical protein K2173_007178 [Erythroxylum novogranatense]
MAEETPKPEAAAPAPATPADVVVEKPVTEKTAEVIQDEAVVAGSDDNQKLSAEKVAITQSDSFKEETNIVGELPDPEKKALDELKKLIQEALHKHEFSAPPTLPPGPAKEEKVEKAEEEKEEKPAAEDKKEEQGAATEAPKAQAAELPKQEEEKVEVEKVEESMEVEEEEPKAKRVAMVVDEVVEKVTVVDEDGAKTVEAIEETVVAVSSTTAVADELPKESEEAKLEEAVPADPPLPPEEVYIWGIPLLTDQRSDVILLKFLRARDFKVKDAFDMIKNTVRWRKEFGVDALLEEDLGNEYEKFVYMHGFDKENHRVCYNVYGAFQDKELFQNCFGNELKRAKFLRWRIQALERSIRSLDFNPGGICTIVQVNDLKDSPGPGKKELRQVTNQALNLLQDNYPEFVARQVFINVPWWYLALYRMINPFLTRRSKSKFVFTGPSRSSDTLFKYIGPEQVPVQYGGLSREGEQEFAISDAATVVTIKPASKHTVEFSISEECLLVWELRVVGADVSYGAEFIPTAEDGYTVIVSKTRKISFSDESVISNSFKIGKPGKVVLTIDNQALKKKKLLYRSKTKPITE